ncbi:MAG: hypothetical protein SWX82_24465 [Cyanobacteriota bacterium]|nr:hypothetical protein [Cyanobacteriota bacterium]
MVYRNKKCLVREQDAPTVVVTKIMTMHDHVAIAPFSLFIFGGGEIYCLYLILPFPNN